MPGTSLAFPQVPAVSSTTNAWDSPELSLYCPPAVQLPTDTHETTAVCAPARVELCRAWDLLGVTQVPAVSSTTNAWVLPELSCTTRLPRSCRRIRTTAK